MGGTVAGHKASSSNHRLGRNQLREFKIHRDYSKMEETYYKYEIRGFHEREDSECGLLVMIRYPLERETISFGKICCLDHQDMSGT